MLDVGFKYNYIICGAKGFYEIAYYDLIGLDNVKYYSTVLDSIENPFVKTIARINYSNKVNNVIQRPFDLLLKDKFFKYRFSDENKPLCFILFFHSIEFLKYSYFIELKKQKPEIKIIVYFQDIIASRRNFDIDEVKKFADILISYDKGDSMKYNMLYYPTPYSIYNVKNDETLSTSDVYFTGYAKTRYKTIFKVYEKCREQGLACDFNLIGVPKYEQIYPNDIHYNQSLTYKENLQHVIKTRCILEIMQEGAVGFTPRLWEAIVYDKHLVTNNRFVIESEYYHPKSIHLMDDLNDLYNLISPVICNEVKLKKSLSPKNFILFIESLI